LLLIFYLTKKLAIFVRKAQKDQGLFVINFIFKVYARAQNKSSVFKSAHPAVKWKQATLFRVTCYLLILDSGLKANTIY